MKQFTLLQRQLLDYLADGECHNGRILGELLGVSRTAIWKQIRQLNQLGLNIITTAQGYYLSPSFKRLDEDSIRKQLAYHLVTRPIQFHLFAELDSTNRFLKDLGNGSNLDVCCAEKQTLGRGRFGRHWVSPFGENIYLSVRWTLDCCLSKLSGLSLVVSLAILNSIKTLTRNNVRIKWPNDLLWHHKKLCGVLIEATAETNACAQVIIGIGLNVNTNTQQETASGIPWCSLYEITGQYFDRNLLIANLIQSLDHYLHHFLLYDFNYFHEEWQSLDYLEGRSISVVQSGKILEGIATGVTDQGQLCLVDEAGIRHVLSSGDTSLQKQS
jgi:BirA family biotin operon repressor/biotin-[acetyl-CoA-carboxylase] ligase